MPSGRKLSGSVWAGPRFCLHTIIILLKINWMRLQRSIQRSTKSISCKSWACDMITCWEFATSRIIGIKKFWNFLRTSFVLWSDSDLFWLFVFYSAVEWTLKDSHAFLNLSGGVMESIIVFMNELYEIACKYVWIKRSIQWNVIELVMVELRAVQLESKKLIQ